MARGVHAVDDVPRLERDGGERRVELAREVREGRVLRCDACGEVFEVRVQVSRWEREKRQLCTTGTGAIACGDMESAQWSQWYAPERARRSTRACGGLRLESGCLCRREYELSKSQ